MRTLTPTMEPKNYRVDYRAVDFFKLKDDFRHTELFPFTDKGIEESMDYIIARLKQVCDGEFAFTEAYTFDIWLYEVFLIDGQEYTTYTLESSAYCKQFISKLSSVIEDHWIIQLIAHPTSECKLPAGVMCAHSG